MGNTKRRIAVLAAAAVMTSAVLTGCGNQIDSKATVLTVGEEKVTMDVANFFARHQQAISQMQYSAMLGEDFWGMSLSEGSATMEEEVKKTVLESLEEMYVLEDHMEEYKVSLTEDEKKKIQDADKAFVKANSEETLEKVSGSEESVSRVLELITIQNKMREAIIADVDTKVSDEEAAQKSMQYVFFSFTKTDEEGNNSDMTEEEKSGLKHTAEAFAAMAKKADDFEKLAEEQGQSASTLTFDGKDTSPTEDLIKAADALKAGEVTDVIEGENGYYVAKVTSLFDKDATETEKNNIIAERQNTKYREVVDKLVDDTKIKVNENEWKKISFTKLDVTMKQEVSEEGTEK